MGFDAIAGLATAIISRIWPDASEEQKQKFTLELQQDYQAFQTNNAQVEVNKVEASSASMFVAGARPYIMWVCGVAYSWQFVLQPMISYIFLVCGHPVTNLPVLDYESLNTLLYGMLGIGGMRSFEKLKGLTK